jgi:hypothetical protein
VLCIVDRHWKKLGGRSHSHIGSLFLWTRRIFLDMMSRGYVYLLLLDQAGQVGGSVEHLEGKGEESVVAILRFLCGNTHLCRLRTGHFGPDGKL